MFGRRKFLGAALGSPILSTVPARQTMGKTQDGKPFYVSYDAATQANVDRDTREISVFAGDGEKLAYVEAADIVTEPPLVTADGRRWMPSNGVLDIRQCASASALASDFSGVCAQAIDDAVKNGWVLKISKGEWETQPIYYEALKPGRLHIDFAPYSILIGAKNYQHFPGDGVRRSFRLTEWVSSDTDSLTAMIVHQDNSYTILRAGPSRGYSRSGKIFKLGGEAPTPQQGETLVVSARNPIFSICGEGGDFSLRIQGGHFDNGRMGYVASQASGTCVSLTTIRDLYWDGGPVFENTSKQSVYAKSLLDIHGDSGLVLGNVERANIYGAQFLFQPDVGNYTTGLARGGKNAIEYHRDDGRFINFFGASAKGCGTGFRSARNGGGYGLYGCSVEEGHSAYLSANVSASLPAARNIHIHGLTCRKITYDAVDVRDVYSLVISGLLVEDWGRSFDGSVPDRRMALLSFGKVKHLEASGIRCTYEEWSPPKDPAPVVSFANGLTTSARIRASIEVPYGAIGNGSEGIWISPGLGPVGDLEIDLTTTNIDSPIIIEGEMTRSFVKAKVTAIRSNYGETYSVERYNIANGKHFTETDGVPFEEIGDFPPQITLENSNEADTIMLESSTGTYVRQGNLVRVSALMEVSVAWERLTSGVALRLDLSNAASLPDIGRLLDYRVNEWMMSGTDASGARAKQAGQKLVLDRIDGSSLAIRSIGSDGQPKFLPPNHWLAETSVTIRISLSFSYVPPGLLS